MIAELRDEAIVQELWKQNERKSRRDMNGDDSNGNSDEFVLTIYPLNLTYTIQNESCLAVADFSLLQV